MLIELSNIALPATWKATLGLVVPMPTSPALVIVMRVVLFVSKAKGKASFVPTTMVPEACVLPPRTTSPEPPPERDVQELLTHNWAFVPLKRNAPAFVAEHAVASFAIFTAPATSSIAAGPVTPIPTRPLGAILTRSSGAVSPSGAVKNLRLAATDAFGAPSACDDMEAPPFAFPSKLIEPRTSPETTSDLALCVPRIVSNLRKFAVPPAAPLMIAFAEPSVKNSKLETLVEEVWKRTGFEDAVRVSSA